MLTLKLNCNNIATKEKIVSPCEESNLSTVVALYENHSQDQSREVWVGNMYRGLPVVTVTLFETKCFPRAVLVAIETGNVFIVEMKSKFVSTNNVISALAMFAPIFESDRQKKVKSCCNHCL